MKNNTNWLEQAISFNVYHISDMPHAREATYILFMEVKAKLGVIKEQNKYRDAVRAILLNVYVGWSMGLPVKYSRNANDYNHHKRYGMLFYRHDRFLGTIDTLQELGYLNQAPGFYDRAKKVGRQTRMWATPKLTELFQAYQFDHSGTVQTGQPPEIIQLKNKNKKLIGYVNRPVADIRDRLENYNDFMSQQVITVDVPTDGEVSLYYIMKLGQQSFGGLEVNSIVPMVNQDSNNNIDIQYHSKPDTGTCSLEYHTDTYTMTNGLRDLVNDIHVFHDYIFHNIPQWYRYDNRFNNINRSSCKYRFDIDCSKLYDTIGNPNKPESRKVKFPVSYLGIQNIRYTTTYNYLHRVFNRSSFELGGRFWGAYHITMPKEWRKHYIYINGNPTVELDYKSLHVRMLYHIKNINYTEDPYTVCCSNDDERGAYKIASLIVINADNPGKAVWATRDKLVRDGIIGPLDNNTVKRLVYSFQTAHEPIAQYMCSGVGLELQYKDSLITDGILTRLMGEGIPCLPVHDSYIVEAQHEEALHQVMTGEYQRVMNYQPVIERAN